jgi:aconitate hydratase
VIKLYEQGGYLLNGTKIILNDADAEKAVAQETGRVPDREEARKGVMSHDILKRHDTSGDPKLLKIKFDLVAAHDLNGVNIIQSARASGMKAFSVPFLLAICHDTCTAGTRNEDDRKFLLSAAYKYGALFVPAGLGIIHQYMREMEAAVGKMIITSDSHTRYGPFGTIAVGEGGPEISKQLAGRTYDIYKPEKVAVCLTGAPQKGIGPHDVAIAIIGAVFRNGFVKNRVMEFVGEGVANLSVDFRMCLDTMTCETSCWSSLWRTDEKLREFFEIHGRPGAFRQLDPAPLAYYDRIMVVELDKIKSMIALPFHPSNAYTIEEVKKNPKDILLETQEAGQKQYEKDGLHFDLLGKIKNGKVVVDQGIIGSCAGGSYENIVAAADILSGKAIGAESFNLFINPSSQSVFIELSANGSLRKLMEAGAVLRPAFCGVCSGDVDIPANGELSVRHVTRNFSNREGSNPNDGQLCSVALMDARSIAATALHGGELTAATELNVEYTRPAYHFDGSVYRRRSYDGRMKPKPEVELHFGPSIKDWPVFYPMGKAVLVKLASVLPDPVITTDDLIPARASAYRSDPLRLAEYALSMKDPAYVPNAKAVRAMDGDRRNGVIDPELKALGGKIKGILAGNKLEWKDISVGAALAGNRVGDGSAREVSATVQKVLGAWANFAKDYVTKRYASNLKNWGVLPLLIEEDPGFSVDDYILMPCVRAEITSGAEKITAYWISSGGIKPLDIKLLPSDAAERDILAAGCLINYYKASPEA